MGSKLSSLFFKKRKKIEYSPQTAQKMENERRTGKLIYSPLSSIADEEPKRSLLPDGGLLYKPIYMNPEPDQHKCNCIDQRCQVSRHHGSSYKQHDDGTFSMLSRHCPHDRHVFSL